MPKAEKPGEGIITLGRKGKIILASFTPHLPESDLAAFASELYPYETERRDDAGEVKGLIYDRSVFIGSPHGWERECILFHREQGQAVGYELPRRRVVNLADLAIAGAHQEA